MATGVLAWLAYDFQYAPVIYSDDWSQIVGQYVRGSLQWLDWSNRRPLLDVPLLVLTGLFGLNIGAFHFAIIVLHVLASLQLYWLLRRIGACSRSFAMGVSLLFLVYPADYTHMWLTMVGAWVVINLLLAYAHLLLVYANTGAAWSLVASCSLLLASLGIYEAQLGLALTWSLLLLWTRRKASLTRKIALLIPVAIGLLFAVWRILGMRAVGITDPYMQRIQLCPSLLLHRVWLGLKVLAWSWAVPLQRGLGIRSYWLTWAIIAALVCLCWLAAAGLSRLLVIQRDRVGPDALKNTRSSAIMVGIGLAFAVAGYLPYALLAEPNLTSMSSRVNLFATIGIAVIIVSILATVGLIFNRKQAPMGVLTLASLVPLVFLGTATQAWVQKDSRVAWVEQKDIWQGLFTLCPDLRENTTVYLILPGYKDRWGWANWRRTPFDASWEISSGLQVLYGKQNLHGDILFTDIDRGLGAPALTEQGIVDYWSRQITPFNKAVFVSYEGTPRRLRMVNNLESELQLPWEPQDYAPEVSCLPGPAPDIQLRRLVTSGN